jgi:hypothetical protein
VCGEKWTPLHATQAPPGRARDGRPWQAGDGPIPDGTSRVDFIQIDRSFSEAEKRGNLGPGHR